MPQGFPNMVRVLMSEMVTNVLTFSENYLKPMVNCSIELHRLQFIYQFSFISFHEFITSNLVFSQSIGIILSKTVSFLVVMVTNIFLRCQAFDMLA